MPIFWMAKRVALVLKSMMLFQL